MSLTKHITSSIFIAMVVNGQISIAADSAELYADSSPSALQISIERQQQINRYEEQLAALEIEFGGFDQRLMESLQGLSGALIAAGDFEEGDRIINRRLQLVRTIDGPANLIQLPIIDELIENDIRLADWESVAERFEYIYWMYSQNADANPTDLLKAKDELIHWYFTSIYLANPRLRVRSFIKAREFQRENFRLAEKTFSGDQLESIPWLYKEALLQFQLVAFLRSEDELGLEAREDIAMMEGIRTEMYLRGGLNAIKQIRSILSDRGNLEAEAMAMIYEADYQMILGLGTAARVYRAAMEKLREAGIEEGRITDFFMRPVVVPVAEFFDTLDEALAYQSDNGYQYILETNTGESEETLHLGDFIAWNESIGSAQRPVIPERARSIPIQLNETKLSFTLSSRGYTRNPRPIFSDPDVVRVKRDARDALREMQFRPRFVNGRWKQVKGVTMRYFAPPKL